ncbi:tryptophan dimethylallyltransferase family protein [Streptomyces sp. NPDC056656]|uniref:tryptophan dimethylallyltransferase family protein n=1 Tax=Streptomyces sp. NPDC056656 TaxID=3345895 RepID=UPI00369F1BB5
MWHTASDQPIRTFRDVLNAHMDAALAALKATDDAVIDEVSRFVDLLGPWSRVPIEDLAPHRSFAANDEWPIELSFAFARADVKLRVLVEEITAGGDLLGCQLAGQELLRRLAKEADVSIDRYLAIEDLYFPIDAAPPRGDFSLMHALELHADGRAVLHKAYLNPGAAGAAADPTVTATMDRLGLADAWTQVERSLAALSLPPEAREASILALDLDPAPEARVKVYLRHRHASASDIDSIASVAADYLPGAFEEILQATFGSSTARLRKAPMTALAFVSGQDRPTSATLYCPLYPNLPNDAAARDRLVALLKQSGIAPNVLEVVLRSVSGPLPERHRRISWFGYKRPASPVVTVYAGLRDPTGSHCASSTARRE